LVGTAFSHLKGATPLPKCTASTIPFLYILPNRLRHYCVGYSLSLLLFLVMTSFLSIQRPKKRSKRTSLIRNNTLKAIYHTRYFFHKLAKGLKYCLLLNEIAKFIFNLIDAVHTIIALFIYF